MKAQSIQLQSHGRAARAVSVPSALHRIDSLPCTAFMVLVSALPAAAIVLLATWASGAHTVLPVAQAATGLSGFVFLALALESSRTVAAWQALTGLVLFTLAWASMAVSAEWLIVGAMALAAWVATALFHQLRQRCA